FNVGPYTAGQKGNVILKASKIEIDVKEPQGDLDVPAIPLTCKPPDNTPIAAVTIDREKPFITLKGDNPMVIEAGSK
ncbi:hypothetical protein RYX45_25795, partial [Alkalihalophilus pseudofirmus]